MILIKDSDKIKAKARGYRVTPNNGFKAVI